MPSLTGTDLVKALYPDLVGLGDPAIDLEVEIAAETLGNPCVWGRHYALAVALFAAHNLEMSQVRGAGGATGPITSKRVGRVSVSYGFSQNSSREDGLDLTPPGRRFLDIMLRLPTGAISSTSRLYQRLKPCGDGWKDES